MKCFLLTCVSFVLISRVFSSIQTQESLADTDELSIHLSEINMEHLQPERRKKIMEKYLDSLPKVEHWIDPYDMIGSSLKDIKREMKIEDPELIATETISRETISNTLTESSNPKRPAPDPKSPRTDSKKTDSKKPATDPKKLTTNTKIPEAGFCNAETDSCKASAIPNEQKVFCTLDSIYVTRWIRRLLNRIEKESDNESSTISFSLDTTTLESLKEMSNAKLFEISTFDDIISNLLSQATITTKEPFTWYRTFVYYSDTLWVILCGLSICGIAYVIHRCFITYPIKTTLCIVIVISVFWHWMHLYKQQMAIQHAELASMQMPTQCRKHDFGLLEHINEYFKSWFTTNDCSKYYEALLVDPLWKVSITMAISEAFTAFVFQPLSAASRAINTCIKQLFDGLPIYLAMTLITFIFLLALILRDYSVRFFWFTGIEPARRVTGSRVEEVQQPTFMQNVTMAARNALSDNQSPPIQSIPAEISTGSSERPRPLMSNSIKPDTNQTNIKVATAVVPTIKNPEDYIPIQSGYFSVNNTLQSVPDKSEASVNLKKSHEKENLAAASSETIPKTPAIEDTSRVELISTTDGPNCSKADAKDQDFQEQEDSNLKNTLSDSFEVLPIPSDDDSNIQSFCSNCDSTVDILEEYHKGCKYYIYSQQLVKSTHRYLKSKMAMDFLFGRRKTPEELLRQNQRALNKAMRDLDRERTKMEQQEKKIINDIKKMAKENQMDAVKIMAKDLVRTRRYVKKFILMRANIQAVSLKIQTLRSQNAMATAMKGVTRAMGNMNKQLNLPQIQKIMQEFEKQSEIMDMKEEMINDTIDDAMGDDDDEEESDAIVAQVLDELGLDVTGKLNELPSTGGTLSSGTKSKEVPLADVDADLQARLENLRRE
ncbi:hypothetical protein JTE90_027514 [Oedothorax gibbosus]|uniref:Chloride channel CLIC-like protein 1 n=1 Tax=Oedothorax gibbosus TaxID=931172 RepID=A0AAV6VL94_9ARAC|nr:hypothetical protein JTE90_027514 [Oedothorax gibbosus]